MWLTHYQAMGCQDCLPQNQQQRPPEYVQAGVAVKGAISVS